MTFVAFPLRLIGYLVPKDKNLWVFGAWLGEKYGDNPKYLYEYISTNTQQKTVWLTKNKKVYERLRRENKRVHYFYSVKGIYFALRAKYVVFCVAYEDVSMFSYLFSAHSTLINLWHGTPLKRLTIKRTRLQTITRRFLISLIGRECDYVGSTTPLVSDKLTNYFDIPKDHFLETGYPRNDALFVHHDIDEGLSSRIKGKKAILYMPTFREYSTNGKEVDLFGDYGFDSDRLDAVLKENNAVFLVKLHFRDMNRFNKVKGHVTSRIILLTDDEIDGDIYTFLPRTDLLITDYSSVYFDYLLLNRPIIFSSFDIEHYEQSDRGFYFNYEDVTPGPKASNWLEVEKHIAQILKRGAKPKSNVSEMSRTFNGFSDGNSSRRVYEYLKKV